MSFEEDVIRSNEQYVRDFGSKGELSHRPTSRVVVLTCMDTRLEPDRFLGTELGSVNFVRNAGGRASDDAIRSLVVGWKLLGAKEFYVIHHTDCGMSKVTGVEIAEALKTGAPESSEGEYVNWLTIGSEPDALIADVERIRNHPLIPGDIPIRAYMYQVDTGRMVPVEQAMEAGLPKVVA